MLTIQSKTNKNTSSKYQPKYGQIQINYKNKTLTHVLYVDNSKQQQQKQIK